MPSKRPQLNVRVKQETVDRLNRLQARMAKALGIEVSQADVISAALLHLEATKYGPELDGPAPAPSRRKKGSGS
jgi:hypothetical protein